jgi:hypothetical protein
MFTRLDCRTQSYVSGLNPMERRERKYQDAERDVNFRTTEREGIQNSPILGRLKFCAGIDCDGETAQNQRGAQGKGLFGMS